MVNVTQALDILIKRQLKVLRFLGVSSGTFKIPTDVNLFYVTAVAGGGAGTADSFTTLYSSGGGSGEYVHRKIIGAIPGETLSYSVGAGGAADRFSSLQPANNGQATVISRNGNEIFRVQGGQGGQIVSPTLSEPYFIGGAPGWQTDNPRYSTTGGYGRLLFYRADFSRGKGGSNPLGSSKLLPNLPITQQSPLAYGYGYGGGGIGTETTDSTGNGGDGALIIEYFTST